MPMPEELALVPTLAEMAKLGIRVQALRDIADDIKEARLGAAFDWLMSRLAKRVKRPLVALDDQEAREAICLRAASMALKWNRGVNPRAGQDELIKELADEADQYVKDVRSGAIEPLFVDSTPAVDEQGPYGGGDKTADAWSKCGSRSGCGGCP